jgi:hypothetical protein
MLFLPRFFLSLAIVCLCGCAGTINAPPVRKVTSTKNMRQFELRARQLGNETYPKIVELLDDRSPRVPRQFSIVFKPLKSENTAETHVPKRAIFANSDYLSTNSTTYFDNVLVHEMTHLLQPYPTNAPSYWVEGIADYVRYKLGFTNGIEGPLCSASYPHYTAGYQCAGAFLLYIDATYGLPLVRKLHRDLRDNCYSDAVFAVMTGKSLAELWADFQQTPAFPGVARRMNEAYAQLGCACPVPRHVQAYVFDQLGGATTRQAGDFLNDLRRKGLLPGVANDEHGTLRAVIAPGVRMSDASSLSRTFVCMTKHKEHGCRYLLVRESEDAPWRLGAAWRITSDGHIIEPLALAR